MGKNCISLMGAMLLVTALTVTAYATSATYEITGKGTIHITAFLVAREQDTGSRKKRMEIGGGTFTL